MPLGVILVIAWMGLEFMVVIVMILWGFENGQWKDIEEPKYRMLVDRELQPWPARKKKQPKDTESKIEQGDQT